MGYIEDIRAKIGNMRIMLPGCCVLIRNCRGEILMQQRTHPYGKWGLPGGLMELGESPEDTVRREVLEETGLRIEAMSLFGAYSGEDYLCVAENGNEFQVVTLVYETNEYSGEATVSDGESLSLEWLDINNLPHNIAKTHSKIINDYVRRERSSK